MKAAIVEGAPAVTRCGEPLGPAEIRTLFEQLRRREPKLFLQGHTRRCRWCERYAGGRGRPCPGCAARGKRLLELVEVARLPLADAGRRLGVDPGTAETLLERARYRVERHIARVDYTDNAFVRELYYEVCEHDPEMSPDRLAQLAGYSDGTHVARLLGLRATSSRCHGEKTYPGQMLTTISVENAARLVRALGRDPVEFRELGL